MKIIFYGILMPIAWLPLKILYLLGDLAYIIVYYVLRYRRKIVWRNLTKSFPNKEESELKKIEKLYYKHICDLLAEAIWMLRAKPMQLMDHYKVTNREVVNKYYENGQSIILLSSHYNNWEFMVASLNFQLLHHGVGVGKPLDNKSFGFYLTKKRARYGTEIVDQTNVRDVMAFYDKYKVPTAYMMLSDQSPSNPHKSYWTEFLCQDTAFLYGAEHFARKYNYPVLYYSVRKIKRGYYEVTFSELCKDVTTAPEYSITERYAKLLEQIIKEQPEYWLWSHRRWKLTHEGRIQKNGKLKIIPR